MRVSFGVRLSIPPWFDCGWDETARVRQVITHFQSHLGSIAAGIRPLILQPRCLFQSHLGSIAAQRTHGKYASNCDFQSHLGSIAARPGLCSHKRPHVFQSHLGSIAAGRYPDELPRYIALSIPPWFDCGLDVGAGQAASETTFNPTLVRLRQRHYARFNPPVTPFNPTLVRLRPNMPIWMSRSRRSFNPTLVRLRPRRPMHVHPGSALFQSHLGSIAACSSHGRHECHDDFQSHLGSIAAPGVAGIPRRCTFLSIPPWFDCGLGSPRRYRPSQDAFNPTLVRLRLVGADQSPAAMGSFNPTLVRLRPWRYVTGPSG